MERGMVIVGAGHAGCRAAQALRAGGWAGPLHLVNGEDRKPYERPPLSKSVLAGLQQTCDVPLLPEGFLAEQGIEYVENATAVSIDRAQRIVELSSGLSVPYEKLLLATGSEARTLSDEATRLGGVVTLRSAADCDALAALLRNKASVVIIGAGLIGLEVAATAVSRGCSVSVIETAQRLLTRILPAELEVGVRADHVRAGVSFFLESSVRRIHGSDVVTSVELESGLRLPCDVLLICIGSVPRIALAASCGLETANGVVVNPLLQTDDPHVFASGDAAAIRLEPGAAPVRLESWKNAGDQGETAARNMLGADVPYAGVPWMWSDQFSKVIQAVGVLQPGQRVAVRQLDDDSRLAIHLEANGSLVGATAYGALGAVAKPLRLVQSLIERGISPSVAAFMDASDIRRFLQAELKA